MNLNEDPRRNASGCFDPTAYEAIRNMESEYVRYKKFLGCLFRIGELSDYYIEEVVIKDKRTGKIWRQ